MEAAENESTQSEQAANSLLAGYANEFRDRMNVRGLSIPLDLDNPYENVYVLLEELSINIMATYISLRYLEDQVNGPPEDQLYNQ